MTMKTIRLTCALLFAAMTFSSWGEIPPGYYATADGRQDEELKNSLHDIISRHRRIEYGSTGTWGVFRTSDVRPDGSIWDMYSDVVRYFPAEGSHPEMNIEHSVPKSWWGELSPFIYDASYDLHHLVPADASANLAKSNNILGEVGEEATFDNGVSRVGKVSVGNRTLTVFEPADEYKGDFARMYMYVATCYQDYTWMADGVYMFESEGYPTLTDYSIELLMRWHREDPVSEKEIARNEAVYKAQQNRNPFIDYPAIAEYLWGDSIGFEFHSGASDDPYMTTPVSGSVIEMGAVMQGGSLTYVLPIAAQNLQSPLSLAWKGNKGIVADRTSISETEAAQGTDVCLTYYNSSLSGTLRDTLVISGGGLYAPVAVTVQVSGTASFVTLPASEISAVAATLHWVEYPAADSYKVKVYQGASEATDLFISAYVEGSSYNKAIALYNGTTSPVLLSDYGIALQQNGYGDFKNYYALPGVWLQPQKTYIMVNSQCSNEELLACADLLVPSGEESPLNFNGNDAVGLYHSGVITDVVGYRDEVTYWGQDMTLYRQPAVMGPSASFVMQEWRQAAIDDFSGLQEHTMTGLVPEPLLVYEHDGSDPSCRVEELSPLTAYTYAVTATVSGTEYPALCKGLFTTTELQAPSLRQPDDITCESFVARWEAVEGAESYEVDCFTLEGNGSVTVTEGFDEVGSSGKPLPEGWTGTASGNYTSDASSGATPPSVSLKNDGEYIESPQYDAYVSGMSFMYRFASQATGSYLVVEKMSDEEWSVLATIAYENTSKHTLSYEFAEADKVEAFRFTYHKEKGNLAIDDVTVTYGKNDTVYVDEQRVVTATETVFTGLEAPVAYYYRVRAVKGDYRSAWSHTGMAVTDPDVQGSEPLHRHDVPCTYRIAGDVLWLDNLPDECYVSLYAIQGVLCHRDKARGASACITLPGKGIYVVQIVWGEGGSAWKVVNR